MRLLNIYSSHWYLIPSFSLVCWRLGFYSTVDVDHLEVRGEFCWISWRMIDYLTAMLEKGSLLEFHWELTISPQCGSFHCQTVRISAFVLKLKCIWQAIYESWTAALAYPLSLLCYWWVENLIHYCLSLSSEVAIASICILQQVFWLNWFELFNHISCLLT